MRKLLKILGLGREEKHEPSVKFQPEVFCNISDKNNYINTLYLKLNEMARARGYTDLTKLTNAEMNEARLFAETQTGVKVKYDPNHFSFGS